MAKPATLPTLATDANYPAGAAGWNGTPTKVAVPAGKQAEGFEPSERPPAQYLNWLFNLIYLWLSWINGIFGDDDSLQVSTLYETNDQEHGHHACAFIQPNGSTGTFNGSIWTGFTGASTLLSPLTYLRPGDHITQIVWVYDRNGTGTVTVHLVRRPIIGGGEVNVQSDPDNVSVAGVAEHDIPYDHVVEAGFSYLIRVDVTDATHVIASAHVTFSRPRPAP